MKKFLSVCFAFFAACAGAFAQVAGTAEPGSDAFGSLFGAARSGRAATSVGVFPSASRVPAGGKFSLLLKISMLPGWHVYWKNPGEAGLPLSVEWKNVPVGVELGEWRWSAPKYSELQGIANYVFEDVGYAEIPVRVAAGVPAGALNLAGTASWLACDDDGCYPQDAEISVRAEIVPAGESAVPANAEVFAEAGKAFPRAAAPEISEAKYFVGEDGDGGVFLTVSARKDIAAGAAEFPRFFPESEKFSPDAANVKPSVDSSDETALLRFELPLKPGETLGGDADARGVLAFGDGTAYEIVPARAAGVPAAGSTAAFAEDFSFGISFLGVLATAFLGGLILNLMPCVFPVLGLKIMHFVGKAGSDRKKIARHGFVFAFGVLISFWILAGALIALRLGGAQLGWGFQLQEPIFVYGMALLLFVFGLSMSGVFEFGAGATAVGGSLQEKSGYAGSFFSGVLAVVVATPCAAPFLAPALGSALAMPPSASLLVFTAIALGLAAPYVALSCFPALLEFLPKPGAWMETFRQAMAFLLYAPALYFVWVLTGQVEDAFAQRDLLLSFAAVALACWIYGRWGAQPWRSRAARIAGTLAALAIFAGAVAHSVSEIVASREFSSSENAPSAAAVSPGAWGAWSPEAQARALDEGKIVYVDFTARWCATCQVNKRVYSDEALRNAFAEASVVKLRADWTNKNPTIAAELRKYGRAAVPVNVFLKKGRAPVILGELFAGPETVLDGLARVSAPESVPAAAPDRAE